MCKKVSYEGVLNLAGITIPCYVLDDGSRVLSTNQTQIALKMVKHKATGKGMSKFLERPSLLPYVSRYASSGVLEPVICYKGNKKMKTYKAEALTSICKIFLEARRAIELTPRQAIIAEQCEILMTAFAEVGLIALIDEATGYQAERDNTELQAILAAYISEEVARWQLTFSQDFYRELYRLYNIPESAGTSKPLRVGYLTAHLIYDQLPEGVFSALKEKTGKNDSGNWNYQLHRNLTEDIGRQDLKRIINEVTAIMAISDNKEQFKRFYNRRFSSSNRSEQRGAA